MLVCLSHQLNISLENKHFIPNKVRRSWRGSCLVFLCNYRVWLPLDFTGMVFSNLVGLFHSNVSTFKQTNKKNHLVRIQIMLGQGNPNWICYQYPSQKQTNKYINKRVTCSVSFVSWSFSFPAPPKQQHNLPSLWAWQQHLHTMAPNSSIPTEQIMSWLLQWAPAWPPWALWHGSPLTWLSWKLYSEALCGHLPQKKEWSARRVSLLGNHSYRHSVNTWKLEITGINRSLCHSQTCFHPKSIHLCS